MNSSLQQQALEVPVVHRYKTVQQAPFLKIGQDQRAERLWVYAREQALC